jgi:hypothetical protein
MQHKGLRKENTCQFCRARYARDAWRHVVGMNWLKCWLEAPGAFAAIY